MCVCLGTRAPESWSPAPSLTSPLRRPLTLRWAETETKKEKCHPDCKTSINHIHNLMFVVFSSLLSWRAEMRRAPSGGGSSGEGDADPGSGPAVLPHHADREAHGAQSRSAVQTEDHQRLLSPVWRTGETHWCRLLRWPWSAKHNGKAENTTLTFAFLICVCVFCVFWFVFVFSDWPLCFAPQGHRRLCCN